MRHKKLGVTLALAAFLSSALAGPITAAPLKPIDHVTWMQSEAILNGTGTGLELTRPITLVESIVLLSRASGAVAKVNRIDPAVKGTWAERELTWAKEAKLLNSEQWAQLHTTVDAEILKSIAKKAGITLSLNGTTISRQSYIAALGDAVTLQVTIGHTNDVHGHVLPDENNAEMGYAKLATLMKELQTDNPNTILIDAGDMIQGTIYSNLSEGQSIVDLVNPLGYSLMVAGNHEFDYGYEQLQNIAKQLQFPILSANVIDSSGKLLLEPYLIKEIGGKKFAFLGLITEDTPIVTHPDNVKGLVFKDPVQTAKEWVPKLQKQADEVIIVSHSGLTKDREIAQQVSGIDLIIGGHSHTKLAEPELVNGIYIVQDWEYGKSLGRVDLFYYQDQLVHFSGGLITYNKETAADAATAARVEQLKQQTDSKLNEKIATAAVLLEGERTKIRAEETNLGNMIADAMLTRTKSMPGYEADAALTNGGGIRASIQPGDITKRNLYDVLPFPNTLAVIEVSGKELRAALENGVSKIEEGAGRFPHVSQITFTFDIKQPAGSRVSHIKVGGKELNDTQTYRIATNDFLIAGGDGYETFKKEHALNTGVTLFEVVEQYLIATKEITVKKDGRITKL